MPRICCAMILALAASLAVSSSYAGQGNGGGGSGGGSASTWTLSAGNTRVQVDATYAYRVYDVSTGALLFTQSGVTFTIAGKAFAASTLRNVTVSGATLTGTLDLANGKTKGTATVALSLAGDTLAVDYTGATASSSAPTAVTESFADGGERIYGLWEHAYNASIDNRGVSKPYVGKETFDGSSSSPVSDVGGVFAASARAPFFMTSKNIGVYTPTEAAGSYALAINTKTSQTFNQPEMHYRVFHGSTPADVLQKYNAAAGPSRLPPLWAFESIWWRDDAHAIPSGSAAKTAQDLVLEDSARLQQYHIPAGAIWIDRPYGSNTHNLDSNVGGWGNMDFEPAAFPDPGLMSDTLSARGMRLIVWVANKANNSLYDQANPAGYLFSGYSLTPALDLRKGGAYALMQNDLQALTMAAPIYPGLPGISGFKIDRGGEGEMPDAQINQMTTLMQKAAQGALGADYFSFARNINDTGRQYAAVWSGDPDTTFQAFQTSLINGIRCGMINFPMWGSDTGGYSGSAPTKELYARWFGFSTYCPMMEVMQMPGRTVWFDYDSALVTIAANAAATHHDLIPYSYSLAAQNTRNGLPLIRAMCLEFPGDSNTQTLATEYMYGPSLLVAPVVSAGATSRTVYLPAGRWLDYNNRTTRYAGGATVSAAAPLGTTPVFVREGAIIPRGDILKSNNNWTDNWMPALRIEVFAAGSGTSSFDYYDGQAFSAIASTTAADGIHLTAENLPYAGSFDVYCTQPASVKVNGAASSDFTYDAATRLLRVNVPAGAVTVDLAGSAGIF